MQQILTDLFLNILSVLISQLRVIRALFYLSYPIKKYTYYSNESLREADKILSVVFKPFDNLFLYW